MRDPAHWASLAMALAPDGKTIGAVGIELTREARPLVIFLAERVEADPRFAAATKWLARVGGDLRVWPIYEPGSRSRRRLLVDVTDRGGATTLRGRLLGQAVMRSDARLRWQPQVALIDQTSTALARPEPRGGYLAVARVDVIGLASQALDSGIVAFSTGIGLAKETTEQLGKLRSQRDREDMAGSGGELATALVLALWDVAWEHETRQGMDRKSWR